MTTVRTYSVPEVSCGHCKAAIEGEVAKLPSVETVEVDVDAKTVEIRGDADDAALREAIEVAGYDVAAELSG